MGQMNWTPQVESSTFTRASLAISWIQVAENEELMASEYRASAHMHSF
jgi:hypothetical protein